MRARCHALHTRVAPPFYCYYCYYYYYYYCCYYYYYATQLVCISSYSS